MNLQFGDIQETALIPLAIKASETARPNARIKDLKAKEIIDSLGVDVSQAQCTDQGSESERDHRFARRGRQQI